MAGQICLLDRIEVARDWKTRTLGLMFKDRIPEAYGQGLLFPRCSTLHTFHMRFDLDVAFLDRNGQPLEIRRSVPAWRLVKGPRGTRHCLEVRAGGLAESPPMEGWRFEPVGV